MTEISMDAVYVEHALQRLRPSIDDTYRALRNPPEVDGGIAGNMVALISSAGAEVSQVVADSYVALLALALETVSDFRATEDSVTRDLLDYATEIEES